MADRVGMKRSFDVELSERCNALRCQRGMTLDLTSVGTSPVVTLEKLPSPRLR